MAISKDFLWNAIDGLATELERVDPQNVVAARTRGLLDARQMGLHTTDRHIANRAPLPQVDEQLVCRLYQDGNSLLATAKAAGIGHQSVITILNRNGIPVRARGRQLQAFQKPQDRARIERIRAWRAEGKTLEEIGAELRITRERVRQLCLKAGIDTSQKELTPEQKAAVAEYVAGESMEHVAARHGSHPHTLRNWVLREGFAIRPSPKTSKRDPETLKKAEQAAELYRAGKTIAEISRACGYGSNGGPVYRLLAIAGVKPNRGFPNSPEQQEAA